MNLRRNTSCIDVMRQGQLPRNLSFQKCKFGPFKIVFQTLPHLFKNNFTYLRFLSHCQKMTENMLSVLEGAVILFILCLVFADVEIKANLSNHVVDTARTYTLTFQ